MTAFRAILIGASLALAGCGGCAGIDGTVDAGRDAGVDAGSDAARPRDAGIDATPWLPSLPTREVFAGDAGCPALPPPTRSYDPVPPGESPRLVFDKAPATDPEISAALLARDIRTVRFPNDIAFSKMPDGSVALLLNPSDALFITPDGHFGDAAQVLHETTVVPAGGDWLLGRGDTSLGFINYHDMLMTTGFGIDASPSADGGRAWRVLPAVQSTSRAVLAAGIDTLVQACTSTHSIRWLVRYDVSRALAAYYDVFSTEDQSVLFAPGGTEMYKFSSDGDLLVHAAAPGTDAGWVYFHALAYVPACGFYVIARDARNDVRSLERWSADLERLWRFSRPDEPGLELPMIEAQFSVMADCGVLTNYGTTSPSGTRIGGRLKIGPDGRELWRRVTSTDTMDAQPGLPAFALRDGGFLVAGSAFDASGTAVLRFAADGSRTWRYVVPYSVEPGVIIDATKLLTADGTLYWGADRGVGSSWAIVAVATGTEPAPYGWQGSGGNPFRTNGVTW